MQAQIAGWGEKEPEDASPISSPTAVGLYTYLQVVSSPCESM